MAAKAIMVQGTMSNAGKSLLVAGLCRIFHEDGYKTAPFKSQNMALNSYITKEGLEMGRAQVMQAEAAGRLPDVRMNPILLKPTGDTASQVIVKGKVLDTLSASSYFAMKKKLIPTILESYESLAEENDILVLEGAGSPAEINLNENDIVNMGMAKMAKAPVLLVGDIDRGGVFAQLIGTQMLLRDWEKKYLKGMIVNKFRGDQRLLKSGLTMLEERTGVPVVGCVPYLQVDLEEEDSLAELLSTREGSRPGAELEIVVIRLPHLSNFTDFQTFLRFREVNLRYVREPSRLGKPDLIFLPGTKNTMQDLEWLRESGMEEAVLRANHSGSLLFGICGGYQMLGEVLEDPEGIEAGEDTGGRSEKGLGLLPMKTVFQKTKIRTQVEGKFLHLAGALRGLSGLPICGYEVHMGISTPLQDVSPLCLVEVKSEAGQKEKKADGLFQGSVYGSYIHGLFDVDAVVEALLSCLFERKGKKPLIQKEASGKDHKEAQYALLARHLRTHLDMQKIDQILEEGMQDVS